MKRKLILIITCFCSLLPVYVHSEGNREWDWNRDRQNYETVQLKIVNLTNKSIYLYINKLYGHSREIKSIEEYITEKMISSYVRVHRSGTDHLACFLGIRYNNQESIAVYNFRYRISERVFMENRQYIVAVKDSSIEFIEGNVDGVYDYFDESLYQRAPQSDWHLMRFGQRHINYTIKNESGSEKNVYVYTVGDEVISLNLQNGMSETLTFDSRLISLGGIRFTILEPGGILSNISVRLSTKDHYYSPNTVEIQLKPNGHKIKYDNYINTWDINRKPYKNYYERSNR